MLFVSATPAAYEEEHELLRAEQIIRPTGLLDPEVEVRPVEGQIDDLIGQIRRETEHGGKVLVTTLTKNMAEDLTDYMKEVGVRVRYLHSDIDTLERTEIIRDMRLDAFDVLVGINLLREGLDIPEISLVAILDADKEGFLRSETSLVQTIGRAARNAQGHVVMYADTMTDSMKRAIDETNRRRMKQLHYNEEHHITPTQIKKSLKSSLSRDDRPDVKELKRSAGGDKQGPVGLAADPIIERMTRPQIEKLIAGTTKRMKEAAKQLDFLQAAQYRDEIIRLQKEIELK
jgi:excinuclease ABC subunit B